MPKRTTNLFVLDIIIAIDRIKYYSNGLYEGDDLRKNGLLCDGILRRLGIIGEAMNRILQARELTTHTKPYWQKIVGFRNIVIHDYFGLNYDEVYGIISKDLPILEKEIIALFKHLWKEKAMQLDFDDTLNELESMKRDDSVAYLKLLKKTVEKK